MSWPWETPTTRLMYLEQEVKILKEQVKALEESNDRLRQIVKDGLELVVLRGK